MLKRKRYVKISPSDLLPSMQWGGEGGVGGCNKGEGHWVPKSYVARK